MSEIKILARRSSFLERAITFEVDGEVKEVSAPFNSATFGELEARIEREYGDEPKRAAPEKLATTSGKRTKKTEVKGDEKDAN